MRNISFPDQHIILLSSKSSSDDKSSWLSNKCHPTQKRWSMSQLRWIHYPSISPLAYWKSEHISLNPCNLNQNPHLYPKWDFKDFLHAFYCGHVLYFHKYNSNEIYVSSTELGRPFSRPVIKIRFHVDESNSGTFENYTDRRNHKVRKPFLSA